MTPDPPDRQAVIYEVDLTVDAAIAARFDDWLAGHVDDMLALPGFESADIERVETDDSGTARRSVRYRLASRAALDAYLQTHAERMRADGAARFGDAMRASRRILRPARTPSAALSPSAAPAIVDARSCSNCGEHLTGQYCFRCGQRDKHRLISLWELLRDLIGDLFEVDSRVWRTVAPLMFRPGFLTIEYLSGRRVRYTPPLRMYLVLSLVFFVVAGIGGEIEIEDGSVQGDVSLSLQDDPSSTHAPVDAARAASPGNSEELEASRKREDAQTIQDLANRCEGLDTNIAWLRSPAVSDRVLRACERLTAEGGLTRFANKLNDNLPTMMFLFLPLIALVMKVLYIGSRRYYVEHLLFFVHFHSYFFLALTVTVLVGYVPNSVPGASVVHFLFFAAIFVYTPVYLFRSMRNVYGQWWIVTFAKYLVLFVAYLVSLLITFLLGAVFTALTV